MIGLFGNEIRDGFFRYLQSSGLAYSPHIEKNWRRFLEDYDLYKKNMEPNSQLEEPWLRTRDENDGTKFYEAVTADKAALFALMEEFHLPVKYFKPYSDHCIVPDRRIELSVRPTGKAEATIVFHLADAGGLDTEPDPIRKTFTLVDENGLKAELEVRWRVYVQRHHTAYYAFGTIEGHISSRIRRIEISTIEDNKIRLVTNLERDDGEAFRQCPLWEEYLKESDQWSELQQRSLQSLVDHFKSLVTAEME